MKCSRKEPTKALKFLLIVICLVVVGFFACKCIKGASNYIRNRKEQSVVRSKLQDPSLTEEAKKEIIENEIKSGSNKVAAIEELVKNQQDISHSLEKRLATLEENWPSIDPELTSINKEIVDLRLKFNDINIPIVFHLTVEYHSLQELKHILIDESKLIGEHRSYLGQIQNQQIPAQKKKLELLKQKLQDKTNELEALQNDIQKESLAFESLRKDEKVQEQENKNRTIRKTIQDTLQNYESLKKSIEKITANSSDLNKIKELDDDCLKLDSQIQDKLTQLNGYERNFLDSSYPCPEHKTSDIDTCPKCQGKGKIVRENWFDKDCKECNGTGKKNVVFQCVHCGEMGRVGHIKCSDIIAGRIQ